MLIFRELAIDAMIILLGLIYALLIVVYAFPLAARLGVMDHPKSQAHKSHAAPTPLVGGIAILPPALLALGFGMGVEQNLPPTFNAMMWMAFAGAVSMIVGFFDDRRHIPAILRLLICAGIFSIPLSLHSEFVVQYVSIDSIRFGFDFGNLAVPFSLLCLLAFQNAVNMADGRNGLVVGLSIIWSIVLLAQGPHPSNLALACLLVGLCVIFPANCAGRLFLGDAGTYGLAAMIGLATVWIHRSSIGLHTAQVGTMFIIPIIDMTRLVGLRLIRRQSPFGADQSHLHHYLDSAFGWSVGRAVYFALVIVPILVGSLGAVWPLLGLTTAAVGYVLVIAVSSTAVARKAKLS